MPKTMTRGVRNCNPGNIRWKDAWIGLVPMAQRTDKSFCQFTDPKWGIRALGIVLLNYRKAKGIPGVGNNKIDTIKEVIYRWAPPVENDTDSYVNAVAKHCGVTPEATIDMNNRDFFVKLITAIIKHENAGYEYPPSLIIQAVKDAYFAAK